jgi:hypothetical protein
MRVIDARIGGKVIGCQFTTLPGSVERVLQGWIVRESNRLGRAGCLRLS